ncbi:flp pilus-assembly TadE/G-like family protein [Amycolatopsis acidicola]|uniref:Flp pilus-assembly TadE/G-like family protein n=1 Tax=Amycolatopsis acidicola TaxID=2596893 RepID=A0A5N0UKQ6_9PSEU|nr:flp pilus-assembly TadE/G-like family protein [Amycolatopsis acidicola]
MATVWAAGAVAVLLGIAGLLFLLGSAILTRHRATNAADLAALAAAGQAELGVAAACGRAQAVTEEMTVQLVSCRLDQWDALVEVEAAAPGGFGSATAHARAGPVARDSPVPAPPTG